jgi:hypothetical protein
MLGEEFEMNGHVWAIGDTCMEEDHVVLFAHQSWRDQIRRDLKDRLGEVSRICVGGDKGTSELVQQSCQATMDAMLALLGDALHMDCGPRKYYKHRKAVKRLAREDDLLEKA